MTNVEGITYAQTQQTAGNHNFATFDTFLFIADRLNGGKNIMRITEKIKHENTNFIGGKIDFAKGARLPFKTNIGKDTTQVGRITSSTKILAP